MEVVMSIRISALVLSAVILFSQPFLAADEFQMETDPTSDELQMETESSSDVNPFTTQDEERRVSLEKAASPTLDMTKEFSIQDPTPVNLDTSYIVSFVDTCSLDDMASILNGEDFDLIGYSENRKVRLTAESIDAFLAKAGANVEYYEKDQELATIPVALPNDEYYDYQYAHDILNIPEAWAYSTGSSDVIVAVLDTGIMREHEDFVSLPILPGKTYIDGNSGSCTYDCQGHGTMVSGVIAAVSNNSIGVSGICKNVTIMPMQCFESNGSATSANIMSAIYDSADAGADVLNMSFSGPYDEGIEDAILYADSKNCILVAAAGNDGYEVYKYPASLSSVISCGSVGEESTWSDFSTYNDALDIAAPGEHIATTYFDGDYVAPDGTSFSCPEVAAIAALARKLSPTLSSSQFRQLAIATAKDVAPAGFDKQTGYGVIDAQKLLATLKNGTCTITFNSNTGSAVPSMMVSKGLTFQAPVNPTRPGHSFVGWYQDSACTDPWNFSTEKPTSDMTLYAKWKRGNVANFVARFYKLCLGRQPDAQGLNNWCSQLVSKSKTGAEVAYGFIFSKEFINAKKTNSEYVDILYKAFFNRDADSAGKKTWMNALSSGLSRMYVLAGFVGSSEFSEFAASYGIKAGTLTLTEPRDLYPQTAKFVARFYKECLGRTADASGLNQWVANLQSGKTTGAKVAYGFVFSQEFINKKVSNETYVTILYKAFFNRTPDSAGYASWIKQLKSGTDRKTVLAGFVNSKEFADLAAKYGIQPGTL